MSAGQLRCEERWIVDRGAAATQVVLIAPLLMMLTLLSVQFALQWHAAHVAQTAAAQGLAAARSDGGSAAAGQTRAREVLGAVGERVLQRPQVTAARSATEARVTIKGEVISVAPWLHLPATGRAAGPVDRFVDVNEGG
ncbi:TadE/TadG family type IV pilus assembly protein [Streptomyces boninensis]|uniref:TadE/TadG family type IV pilus assembly protein n=1 Tax=Streptomyces boninensis TaxID=2039455 RepID=UPI003B22566C